MIFAVSDELEFVDDAAGDDQIVADEAGLGDGEEARIHQDRGVNVDFALLMAGDERFGAGFDGQKGGFAQNNQG